MLRIAAFCTGFALSTALALAAGLDEQAPAGAYNTDPSHSSLL
ncbi:hypothetical protein [Sinorhizobium chiapasense]|uniref:Uncharacterized protein n=1 Tax=Sinorhizobium chiapasense TaxID=501572 RepID=A0ABZ2B710_9HYPH